MVDEIRELYTYNRWANQRIRATCAELSAEDRRRDMRSSFPSVEATLGHILSSEWIWLERWNGRSPTAAPDAWDLSTWSEMERRWGEVEAAQRAFVDALGPDDLHRIIEYRNTRGQPFSGPLWQMLRHLVNHSSYHRGQVVTMLRQLGAAAPSTDLILFYRTAPRHTSGS